MAYGEDIAPTDATKAFRRGIKSQTPRIDRFDERSYLYIIHVLIGTYS